MMHERWSQTPGTARAERRCESMKQTKTTLLAAVAVLVSIGSAGAQTSGSGGGAGSGTSSGIGGTTSQGVTRGAPTVGSTPSGPVAPNRSNSEVFPPSRLAPRPPGSVQDPNSTRTMPSEQNDSGTQDPSSLGSGRVPSPATGGINGSTTTPKTASDSIAECEKLWAPRTQMSKSDWTETCRRSQDNLDAKQ
jgi:hypothetical protein